jgi:hypothetical protein
MIMRKILLLAVSTLIAGTAAYSQTTTKTSTAMGSTRFGLKAGVNLAKYSFGRDNADNPTSDNRISAHITGYADIPLSTNFSIQPGISFKEKAENLISRSQVSPLPGKMM